MLKSLGYCLYSTVAAPLETVSWRGDVERAELVLLLFEIEGIIYNGGCGVPLAQSE